MKMIYNGVPINSMKVKHYELNTNDCDMVASDLQSGKTAVARGKKITGTGKAFKFATYGKWKTNLPISVPENVNIVYVGSEDHFTKMNLALREMPSISFESSQKIAEISIDGTTYPISAIVESGMLTFICDQTVDIQMFYGKDEYV